MENCVYKFMNDNDRVIYIGKAKRLESRLNTHKNNPHLPQEAYKEIRKIFACPFQSYADAGIMERAFIDFYTPKYNTQYTKDGYVSVIDKDFLANISWICIAELPRGIQTKTTHSSRNRDIKRADFIIMDGECFCKLLFFKFGAWNSKRKIINLFQAYYLPDEDNYGAKNLQRFISEFENPGYADYPCKYVPYGYLDKIISKIKLLKIPLAYRTLNHYYVGDEEKIIPIYSNPYDVWNVDELARAMALTIKEYDIT